MRRYTVVLVYGNGFANMIFADMRIIYSHVGHARRKQQKYRKDRSYPRTFSELDFHQRTSLAEHEIVRYVGVPEIPMVERYPRYVHGYLGDFVRILSRRLRLCEMVARRLPPVRVQYKIEITVVLKCFSNTILKYKSCCSRLILYTYTYDVS